MSYPDYPPTTPSAAPQGYPPAAPYPPSAPSPPAAPYPPAVQGYPPTQGYPPNQQYPGPYGQYPYMPPKRRVSGKLIGLIAGIGLVVVGLLVWLVIVPAASGGGKDLYTARMPEILKTPAGWGQPVELTNFTDTGATVIDAMVGDVIVLSDGSNLTVVDLKANTTLWTTEMKIDLMLADTTGYIAVHDKAENEVAVFDTMTGQIKGTVPLKDTESLSAAVAGIVLTYDSDTKMVCARDATSLDTCKWTAKQNPSAMFVFGPQKWYNTNNGVVEWATGKPAPFGADSKTSSDYNHSVIYIKTASSDQVLRSEGSRVDSGAPWSYTLQPWSASSDKPTGSPVATGKSWWIPGSLIIAYSDDHKSATAYSKASGTKLWTFDVPDQNLSLNAQTLVGDSVIFDDGANGFIAVNAKTGQQKWQSGGTSYTIPYITDGSRVLYATDADGLLSAFDGNSASFTKLWSTNLPSDNAPHTNVYAIAHHVIAVNTDVPMQLWVLNE